MLSCTLHVSGTNTMPNLPPSGAGFIAAPRQPCRYGALVLQYLRTLPGTFSGGPVNPVLDSFFRWPPAVCLPINQWFTFCLLGLHSVAKPPAAEFGSSIAPPSNSNQITLVVQWYGAYNATQLNPCQIAGAG